MRNASMPRERPTPTTTNPIMVTIHHRCRTQANPNMWRMRGWPGLSRAPTASRNLTQGVSALVLTRPFRPDTRRAMTPYWFARMQMPLWPHRTRSGGGSASSACRHTCVCHEHRWVCGCRQYLALGAYMRPLGDDQLTTWDRGERRGRTINIQVSSDCRTVPLNGILLGKLVVIKSRKKRAINGNYWQSRKQPLNVSKTRTKCVSKAPTMCVVGPLSTSVALRGLLPPRGARRS